MDINKLFKLTKKDLDQNGFVGLDYNMAVLCIIAKRTGKKMNFMIGAGKTYDEKIEYWASKRHFCHLQVGSEDELIEHAYEKYKKNTKFN